MKILIHAGWKTYHSGNPLSLANSQRGFVAVFSVSVTSREKTSRYLLELVMTVFRR